MRPGANIDNTSNNNYNTNTNMNTCSPTDRKLCSKPYCIGKIFYYKWVCGTNTYTVTVKAATKHSIRDDAS